MSTSLGYPTPAQTRFSSSNIVSASDVLTAKKRMLVGRSFFADTNAYKNKTQIYPNLVLSTIAANRTVVRNPGLGKVNPATPLPYPGCCTSYVIRVVLPVPAQGPKIQSLQLRP
jgi:hypothetical protein